MSLWRTLAMAAMLLLGLHAMSAPEHRNSEKLDSVINMLNSMPDDSTRLRQAFISVQENIDQYWALDLIEYAREQADRQKHVLWALAFRGSKVRWAHHFHDWARMEEFLQAQRAKSQELGNFGNYLSQVGQSAIVMAQMGRFEQSWRYIQRLRKDIEEFGQERYAIFTYLVEAEYYRYSGEEQKRLSLLISAIDDKVPTTPLQRMSLHVELIDAYRQMRRYKEALAHADSVLYVYESYSPERKALPQSKGNISQANLQKVEIYHELGDLPMMKKCLLTAEEYINTTDKKNSADISFWWAKYYADTKDYERSLQHFDEAAAIYEECTSDEQAILIDLEKVKVLAAMGREREALTLCINKLAALDSVHNVMIGEQQTYLGELNTVLEQEKRSEKIQAWKSYLVAISSVILTVIVLGGLIYMIYVRYELKRNYRITEKKLRDAYNADQEKERFLRNITQFINAPLQQVVKSAKRLSEDKTMSLDEQAALVATNKKHVLHLLTLVNNVLDLSRLEAGMMKYAKANVDIVGLLNNLVSQYNMSNAEAPISISSEVQSYKMEIDAQRFTDCVERLFSKPFHSKAPIPAERGIKVERGKGGSLRVIVYGSLFADESKLDETERMANSVNRFVMRDFGSEYELTPDHNIIFTLKSEI